MSAARVPLRVLLVEDQARDAELILHTLERAGYAPTSHCVDSEPDYIGALESKPDIVLCDHALPQFDSVRALQLLQTVGGDIPFIIVSGQIGEEDAVKAMHRGADDYLLKDRLARLGPAVAAALERRRLRAEAQHSAEQLQETRERHRLFLDHRPELLFMKDRQGRYLHVNREFLRAFGLDPVDVIGRRDDEIFTADQAACFRTNDRVALDSGVPVRFEESALYVDGPHTTITVKFPLRDSRGEIYGIGCIATDITERKRIEERYRATFDQAAVGMAQTTSDWH
ncbi:MAG: PAS domain-containing protein, partial [Burkholderiales bacterium]